MKSQKKERNSQMLVSEIWRRGHWKRGICIKLSEIDFEFRDKLATILRTLPLMHEAKYRQSCANLAHYLRQIGVTPPFAKSPFSGFLIVHAKLGGPWPVF